ncbi:hypothetical protein PHJA_002745500 [Phtheirospermum japonicum]|uniref:Uncharacterized protein n=1 Tax=Phtheirospermum japonicum TaxID=374723 RepID=A0A830DBL1_9LAMI|nr:hypothetical protein PHJA_002745500 [Phtheirospermum japonicum]
MYVENKWDGRDFHLKSQQQHSLFHRHTQSKEQVYIHDIKDILEEFMLQNTEIGDGNIEEIVEKMMVMREECL